MSEFLRALGHDPLAYWLAAGGALLLWFASAAAPFQPDGPPLRRLNRPVVFCLTLLGAMFAFRWPVIFHYRPVNPDEAQFLSGALAMLSRGEIWWVDGTTSGPLVMLPLTLPGLLGLPVDFSHGRLVGLLLNWGTVVLTWLALRHVHGDRLARLLVLPLACLMVFLMFWDFAPYNSECAPLFLCALALWLCLAAISATGSMATPWRLALGGFVLGLLPFSKFQVLPLGAAIGCATVASLLRQPTATRQQIIRGLGWLVGSTLAGTGIMLLGLWLSGRWADVHQSYFTHNLYYTQARAVPWNSSGYLLRYLTGFSWGFGSFHYGMLLLLVIGLLGLRQTAWRPLLLAWLLLLAAYFAVLAPGRLYPHYLLFLSLPLTLLVGLQFGHLVGGRSGRPAFILWALFLAVGTGAQVLDRLADGHSLAKLVPTATARANTVNFINQVKRPGDTLAVWGWRPELYVETQLPQATREALTEAQIADHPQRDYYRARFLADVQASQPAFFIDSIGPEDFLLHDRDRQGHETLPGLRDYIAREYTLVSKGDPLRLYVRRSLMSDGR